MEDDEKKGGGGVNCDGDEVLICEYAYTDDTIRIRPIADSTDKREMYFLLRMLLCLII